jgi:hypothetical protein
LAVAVGALVLLSLTVGAGRSAAADPLTPTVTITKPAQGETVSGTTRLDATASALAPIVAVRYAVDGVQVAVDKTCCDWSEPWDTTTVADGTHLLTATAVDSFGRTGVSNPISVRVDNGPAPQPVPSGDSRAAHLSRIAVVVAHDSR